MELKNKLDVLKNNLTLADYEKIEVYLREHKNNLNKYTLALILGGFGLGVLVGGLRGKIKIERKFISNKYEGNRYEGSELERLVEKMIDRKYLG